MKKIILLFSAFLLVTGCGRKCCTNYGVHTFLKYQNSNGDDLLNPTTPNALNEKDIEVYVLRKGVRVRLFNAMLDAQKNFKIRGSAIEKYYMQFYFDIAKESFVNKKVTMFIKYKDDSEDKLVGEFNEDDGSNIMLQRVWVNDIAMTHESYSPEKAFVITK